MTGWFDRAACRGLTHIFYPSMFDGCGMSDAHRARVAAYESTALDVCATCPVRTQCHGYAMSCPVADLGQAIAFAGRTRTQIVSDRRAHNRARVIPERAPYAPKDGPPPDRVRNPNAYARWNRQINSGAERGNERAQALAILFAAWDAEQRARTAIIDKATNRAADAAAKRQHRTPSLSVGNERAQGLAIAFASHAAERTARQRVSA
jgi:hypothetical protein